MNRTLSSIVLALALAAFGFPQEPPGCTSRSTHKKHLVTASGAKKRKVLDLRRRKPKPEIDTDDGRSLPVVASPIYLPQSPAGATATMTASNGYLYILVGARLYKVSEKTMKTVDVVVLGRPERIAEDSAPSKRTRKQARPDDESSARRRDRSGKAD